MSGEMYGGMYKLSSVNGLDRWFGIKDNGKGIISLHFTPNIQEIDYLHLKESALSIQAAQELQEYLLGERRHFSVPLCPKGSVFALRVWEELVRIPYGEVRSYKQIASAIGNPKASRAIGLANHQNPILIMIPCHRVIASTQMLTGYANGLDAKMKLLELEGFMQDKKGRVVYANNS